MDVGFGMLVDVGDIGRGLLCRLRNVSHSPAVVNEQSLSKVQKELTELFSGAILSYLRVSAVIRSGDPVFFAAVDDLWTDEGRLGVFCCCPDTISRISKTGFLCHTYDASKRLKSIHNCARAFQKGGIEWLLSVPIPAADGGISDHMHGGLTGFLTLGWRKMPQDPDKYIRTAQAVAEAMADGFLEVMAPVIEDVTMYYLPYLMPSQPAPGFLQSLVRDGETKGGGGSAGGSLTSQSSSDMDQRHDSFELEELTAPGKEADWLWKTLRNPVSGQDGAAQSSLSGVRDATGGPLGDHGPVLDPIWAVGKQVGKGVALGAGRVSNLSLSSDEWASDEADDATLLKKKMREGLQDEGPRQVSVLQQHPLWLTITNNQLEKAYIDSHVYARTQIDFLFSVFSVVMVAVSAFRDPITWANPYLFVTWGACLLQVLAIWVLPAWYMTNRETYCCATSFTITIANALHWMSALTSPSAASSYIIKQAGRRLLAEPCIQATVVLAFKIRFRTAVLRSMSLLPVGIYMQHYFIGAAWGMAPAPATLAAIATLVLTSGAMLLLVYKLEHQERKAFLSSRDNTPAA